MEVAFAYDRRTTVTASLAGAALDFAANLYREPVSFQGRVKEPVLLRQLLLALHEVILGDFRVSSRSFWSLDPVVTIHPDQVFFEAFSNDESVYARLSAPFDAFEPQGDVRYGTTNIDFTWQLRSSLQDLRSSRPTQFRVGAGGVGVDTQVGGLEHSHFEHKVDLPDSWLQGFLQVQGALAMRPFTFHVRPVDLLTVIAYFLDHFEKRGASHALRFEFAPDEPIAVVLEPWQERFVLRGTHYSGYRRTVRLWGRRRLELLQTVLPYAQRVTVGLLGRGLPHFYICHCGAFRFALVLSGWTRNDWARGGAFDLLAPRATVDRDRMFSVYDYLVRHLAVSKDEMEPYLDLTSRDLEHSLFQLCRAGRAIYDPTVRKYRLRELFPEPVNVDSLFAPDPRLDEAQRLFDGGQVAIQHVGPSDKRADETRALAQVQDGDDEHAVLVSVDQEGRIRFATCQCQFFRDHIMSRGPCRHILAARFALDRQLQRDDEENAAMMVADFGNPQEQPG